MGRNTQGKKNGILEYWKNGMLGTEKQNGRMEGWERGSRRE